MWRHPSETFAHPRTTAGHAMNKRPFVPNIHPCHVKGCTRYAPFGYPGGTWACRQHQLEDKR